MAHVLLLGFLSSERREITTLMTVRHPIHQKLQLDQPLNIGTTLPLVALCKLGRELRLDGLGPVHP
jgi:hypothetical protein